MLSMLGLQLFHNRLDKSLQNMLVDDDLLGVGHLYDVWQVVFEKLSLDFLGELFQLVF